MPRPDGAGRQARTASTRGLRLPPSARRLGRGVRSPVSAGRPLPPAFGLRHVLRLMDPGSYRVPDRISARTPGSHVACIDNVLG